MHWVPQNPPECQFSANVNGSVAKLSILHIDKAEEALNWVNSLLELFKLTLALGRPQACIHKKKKEKASVKNCDWLTRLTVHLPVSGLPQVLLEITLNQASHPCESSCPKAEKYI
jgi:hypothetical protein